MLNVIYAIWSKQKGEQNDVHHISVGHAGDVALGSIYIQQGQQRMKYTTQTSCMYAKGVHNLM